MPFIGMGRADQTTPTGIFSDAELGTLANGAGLLSAQIDNSAGNYTHADIEALLDFATAAPTGPIELYAIVAYDGTNYPGAEAYQVAATAYGPPGGLLGVLTPRAVTSAQLMLLRDVPLPAAKFKLLLINRGGQALDGSGRFVRMWRKRQKIA